MGNYTSCALANTLHHASSRSTKVLLPTGELKQIKQPSTVAEVMLEVPNFFIVNSKSLKMGRRLAPLSADHDLEKGNVYVMFPMSRKDSVVKAKDLGALFRAVNKRVKCGGRVRVFATEVVVEEEEEEKVVVPRLSLEGVEDVETVEFMRRLSMSRSKKPLLETIDEELPVRLRGY